MYTNLVSSILLILISSSVLAKDFNYDTTYWFNKIHLECKTGMCKVWINGEYKAENPYTVEANLAHTTYDKYNVTLNLTTGDFNWRTK